MPVRPVDDWRTGWRWLSVQSNVAAQFVLMAWVFIRDQPLPPGAVWAIWALLAVGLVGRFVKQEPKP
jgi:hypothetical protein